MNSIVNLNNKVMKANEKPSDMWYDYYVMNANNEGGTIWDIMYEHYKDQYTREQINEMTFAELSELIDGMK
jgi:hypothetical protein